MRKFEQVRMFYSTDSEKVQEQYNTWYRKELAFRQGVPMVRGTPPLILDRCLTVRQYEGEETIALAVFYEHIELEANESGPDRGTNVSGASMIPGQKPRRRR